MVALLVFYLLFPAVALWLCARLPWLNKLGVVLVCYLAGIALGSSGLLGGAARALQAQLADGSVALALPLLMFAMDVRAWLRLAGRALLSFVLALAALGLVVGLGVTLLAGLRPDAWQLGGMALGVYSGGTPNLAAIRAALGIDSATFILFHSYDTVLSMAYIMACMSVIRPLFSPLLSAGRAVAAARDGAAETSPLASTAAGRPSGYDQTARAAEPAPNLPREGLALFADLLRPAFAGRLLLALALAAGIVALAQLLVPLAPAGAAAAVGIVLITTLGIGASFVPAVRAIPRTFQLGMYVIYVFCLVVGSLCDLAALARLDWPLLLFVTLCIYGGLLVHAGLCRLAGVDVDSFVIGSVAAICSPPFVPPVAQALGRPALLVPGIITGIVGYALGNYLGIGGALLLRWLTAS